MLVQEARMKQLDNERKQNKQDKKQRKEQQLAGSSTTEVKEKKRKSSVNWQDRYSNNFDIFVIYNIVLYCNQYTIVH